MAVAGGTLCAGLLYRDTHARRMVGAVKAQEIKNLPVPYRELNDRELRLRFLSWSVEDRANVQRYWMNMLLELPPVW